MTRYEALKALVQKWRDEIQPLEMSEVGSALQGGKQIQRNECADELEAALALPEDSKTVNAELYGLAVELADKLLRIVPYDGLHGSLVFTKDDVKDAFRYLSLREASGDPLPYKVVREGDKVRFE